MSKLNGKHSAPVGGPKVFSDEEENMFAGHAIALSEYGFPFTLLDLRYVVKAYPDRQGRRITCFKRNFPGKDWAKSFLNRHQCILSHRFAQNISRNRAAVDANVITEYFSNLKVSLQGVPASHIWNYDETNLVDDPGKKMAITKRGSKYPERICNTSKSCTSLMMCANAEGKLAPPYIVYKSEKLWSTWTEDGPQNADIIEPNQDGSIMNALKIGLSISFFPFKKKQEGKKVLIGDNLSSHLNSRVLRLCGEHNIAFIALPPNSTHLLQPLDVAYFGPMKREWRKILDNWRNSSRGSRCITIPKEQFPSLLRKLLDSLKERLKTKNKVVEPDSSSDDDISVRYQESCDSPLSIHSDNDAPPSPVKQQVTSTLNRRQISIGDYVIVRYEEELFPGIVTSVDERDAGA
ncbi:hypothetical protein ANN_11883 [Periplaneta americana]|uniref:DDE-1 domain-containing protein n=1 Tax=Periplaneta americana TaxID=6978 RepID=A0ABQ8T698_PERAM|nr:hypothetical protein ANN_11883 [Periplaneta americana]